MITQVAVIPLAVYCILTHYEARKLVGPTLLLAHLDQFLFLSVGLLLLSRLASWLIRYRRPRLSKLVLDRNAFSIYINRSFLLPIGLYISFFIAYQIVWSKPFTVATLIWESLLISLGILLLSSVFNQLSLSFYASAAKERMLQIGKISKQKIQAQGVKMPAETSTEKLAREIAGYCAFIKDGRNVKAYNLLGEDIILKNQSLAKIKNILSDGQRFFSTGGWIICYAGIDRLENTAQPRGYKIYLKNARSNFFILNKNDKKRFTDWYEAIRRRGESAGIKDL